MICCIVIVSSIKIPDSCVLCWLQHQQLQGFSLSPVNDESDDDAEEDVGEIDSGDEDDDDAVALDEQAAAHSAHGSIAEGGQNAAERESGKGSLLHRPSKAVIPVLQISFSASHDTECMQ